MPDPDLGQTTGGKIDDAAVASEADVIAELIGRVPTTPALDDKATAPVKDKPSPADSKPQSTEPDPDPKPLFGDVSDAKAEPQQTKDDDDTQQRDDDKQAEDIVADAGFSDEDLSTLKEFVDKNYQGSMSNFIKGWYETRSSNANLSQEVTSLKEQFTAFVDGFNEEPDEDDDAAAVPEVEEFDETIKALNTETESIQASIRDTLGKIHKADREMAKAEGELSRASEDDQSSIVARRDRLEDRKETLISKLDDLESRLTSKMSEVKRAEKSKERTAKAAKEQRAKLREGKSQQDVQNKQIEAYVAARINDEASAYPHLDEDGVKDMHRVVGNELYEYARSLPPGSPTLDIAAFVKDRSKAYVTRQETRAVQLLKRRQGGKKKAATPADPTARRPAAKGSTPAKDPTLNTRSGPWDAQFSRDRARKVLGD
jgi:hypothetical protein